MSKPLQFPKGMEVEVCSNEEGLRGAWFEATVVRSATKNGKVFIEYKNLTTVKGKKSLREYVDEVDLRPIPPREKDLGFNSNEEVDAYYNDGWWEGVVTKVTDQGRYLVYFRPAKEQLEFGASDLRMHREWDKGNWIPPMTEGFQDMAKIKEDQNASDQKQKSKMAVDQPEHKKADQLQKRKKNQKKPSGTESEEWKNKSPKLTVAEYKEGMQVEVSSDEEGFVGAWFTARIVNAVGKDKYLVEFETLRTEDETELLKEEAEHFHIRPPPPEIPNVVSFRLLEEVDAMDNDAWWVGVVSRVLKDSKYIVYFRDNNEEIEFDHSHLRLHQDWINGNWIRASMALNL